MPRILPKYVHKERSRNGPMVYYFRRFGCRRVRLPSPDHPDFRKFFDAAFAGIHVPRFRPVKNPTFLERRKGRVSKTLKAAIRAARTRARVKGVPFDLTLDWAFKLAEDQKFRCSLTGIPFFMNSNASSKVHPYTPSLDRIVPHLGYVQSNVRLVIYAMNVMLMDWGSQVFEQVAHGYRYARGTKSPVYSLTKAVLSGTEKK